MIIRIFLKLLLTALIILIIADIFYELHLNWISSIIVQLGDDILLLSFALFLMSGSILCAKKINHAIKNYFSEKQQAQRRFFFSVARNDYLHRLFVAKKKQLLYFTYIKKSRLLSNNNKKQCILLSKSILVELNQAKNKLTEFQFQQYQQAIKQATTQQNIQHLLELQRKISILDL